jgi:IclR family pca regulon transcriptional regulator
MSEDIPSEDVWGVSVPALIGSRYSGSLDRGLAILGCFSDERPWLGIREISRELGMKQSTTHRYLATLVKLGYVKQGYRRMYALRLGVTRLGMSAMSEMDLREHAHTYLQALRDQTTYTASIATLDGPEIVYVDRLLSNRRDQRAFRQLPADARLLHCTAIGKALLAWLPEPEFSRLTAGLRLSRLGPNTITYTPTLRAELQAVVEQGFAVSDQECAHGLCAIAAPVRDTSEVVAAVGVAAYSSVISAGEMVDGLGHHLLTCADRISARLGYRRRDE